MSNPLQQALALHRSGRLVEAIAAYERLRSTAPGDARVLAWLGMALHQHGEPTRALECLQAAVAAEPRLAFAQLNLGRLHCAAGRAADAAMAFHAAEAAAPNDLETLHTVAEFHRQQGDLAAAATRFERILALAPSDPAALLFTATAHHAGRRFTQALVHLDRLLAVVPDHVPALVLAAQCHQRLGHAELAERLGARALELQPRAVDVHCTFGEMHEQQGRFELARADYERALEIAPDHPAALAGLVGLAGADVPESVVARAAELVDRLPHRLPRRALHHALGKRYSRLGRHDDAFRHIAAANDIARDIGTYSRADQEALVDALVAVFTPEFLAERAGWGSPSRRPVFVVGMPRSGTTLTEQVLASHSQVVGAGELAFFPRLAIALGRDGGAAAYANGIRGLTRTDVAQIAAKYERLLDSHSPTALRIVDKMPMNALNVGLIVLAFPHATIVHCRRDPLDTCVSCYVEAFAEEHAFATDLGHLGHYYRCYERLMRHWTSVLPKPMHERIYEEVVADLDASTRALLDACGLEFEERCLRYYETDRAVRTPSRWQVRQPIYTSSIGKWRRFERHLGALRAALDGDAPADGRC